MAARKKSGAQKSAKPKKRRGPGKPFQPGNPWRIKPGEVRNPGGRPKLLSHSYREWLEYEDDQGVTNAAKVAWAMGGRAVEGDISAARELRQAVEGDRLVLDLSKLNDEQLERIAHGEDPRSVLAGTGHGGTGAAPAAEEDGG